MAVDRTGAADVLQDEPRRWPPSRRAVAVLVALAIVVPAAGLAWSRAHERSLDRRASAQVRLMTGAVLTEVADGVEVQLVNTGPAAVRVLDVRLAGDGYPREVVDAPLRAGDDLHVLLRHGTSCAPGLRDQGPDALVVRVRTARGVEHTARAPLSEVVAETVHASERRRCGLLTPSEAVTFEPLSASTRGRTVVVSGNLTNAGAAAVTVTDAFVALGLTVSAPLPLHLPAAVTGRPTTVPTVFALRVADCDEFARTWRSDPRDIDLLVARMRSAYGEDEVSLRMNGYRADARAAVFPLGLLAETCPSTSFLAP